jgi:hypothetical protein
MKEGKMLRSDEKWAEIVAGNVHADMLLTAYDGMTVGGKYCCM